MDQGRHSATGYLHRIYSRFPVDILTPPIVSVTDAHINPNGEKKQHLNEGLHKLMELMDDACRRLDDTKVIDEEEEGAEEEGVKMIVTPNEEITLEFREFAREIIGLLSTLLRIGAGGPYNCAFYGSRKDFRQGMRKFQKAVPVSLFHTFFLSFLVVGVMFLSPRVDDAHGIANYVRHKPMNGWGMLI